MSVVEAPQTVHHRFSLDAYERMIEQGIITENDRVELIRGEILEKMTVGELYSAIVKKLAKLLVLRFSHCATVSVQDPIIVNDSEPEPDLALLAPRDDFYAAAKPRAKDVLLLIEVAETSLEYDRDVKGPIYAEAQIRDYWIVNLKQQLIEVYRDPDASGQFARTSTHGRGAVLRPLAFDVEIHVEEVLGEAPRAGG